MTNKNSFLDDPSDGKRLPVMEQFYTLQGEGYFSGHAAYFIRLAGCDVGCVWCDVKESWDADKHPLKSIAEIVEDAKLFASKFCVVTGGEPLLYNLMNLTKALKEAGFNTHIETSGSSLLSGSWDWVCISPKKFKAPLPENMPLANELKIIIFNPSDFVWAERYAALASPSCKLYLQPEWEKASEITPLIIDYIKVHPQWQLSLQLHKYLDIP